MHVDDFIDAMPNFSNRNDGTDYAAFFFLLHRLPAAMQIKFKTWIDPYTLFCTYQNEKYRVTGASRMGDIWLTKDFTKDVGYDLRVDIDECSGWSAINIIPGELK